MPLVGHSKAFEEVLRLLTPEVRRRAFGLIAPEGVGRQFFMSQIFLAINEGRNVNITSDDLHIISQDAISIDQIRTLEGWTSLKPVQARFKFLVVAPGEALSLEAQNALLKLLEDTPNYLVVTLVSSSFHCYLPPIRSRLTPVRLFTLDRKDSEAVWFSLGIDPSIYSQLWRLAPGQPGVAVKRLARKYLPIAQAFNKFLQTNPTAMGLLHWQAQLPPDWTPRDSYEFWQWAAYKAFLGSENPASPMAKFAVSLSEVLSQNPQIDTNLAVPSIWHEVMGS
jgi:hypothetical protein